MIVPSGRVEAVAENADLAKHPELGHVWLRGDFLEATDSFVAVRVRVGRMEGDRDGPVPPLAFELARRLSANRDAPTIDASKANVIGVPGLAGVNRFKPVRQPPTFEQLREKFAPEERPHTVAIDVAYLARAAEALGCSRVVLHLTGHPHDPVLVEPTDGSGGEAFVMPLKSSMAPPPPPEEDEDNGDGA